MRIPPKGARLKFSAARGQRLPRPSARRSLNSVALAIFIAAAGLSGAAYAKEKHGVAAPMPGSAETAPPVDACGHPIVTDNLGKPYIDPVCIALSDRLQPPLYIPDSDCNRGVAPYDSRCFFERLWTVMTASPGPPPLAAPPPRPGYFK